MASDHHGKNRATGDKAGEKKRVSTRCPLPPPPPPPPLPSPPSRPHSSRTTTRMTTTTAVTSHGDVVVDKPRTPKGDEIEIKILPKDFGAERHQNGFGPRLLVANGMKAILAGKSRSEANYSATTATAGAAAASAAAAANKRRPSTPSSVSSPSVELLKQMGNVINQEKRRPHSANAILESEGDAARRKMTSTKMKTTPTTPTTTTKSLDGCAASPTPSSTADWVETASSNLRLKREVSEKVFETAERLAEVADSRTKELNALEEEFKRVVKELECYKRFEAKTRSEGILRQETIKNLKWTVVQEMKLEMDDIDH